MFKPAVWIAFIGAVVAIFVALNPKEAPQPTSHEAAPHAPDRSARIEHLKPRIVGRYPHDPTAFTQGLLWHNGKILETTGHHGSSRLRRVDLASGEVEKEISLDDRYFGEGLALVGSELLWLTWKAGMAFRFQVDDFRSIGSFEYVGEGWGLCHQGGALYRSDGTATLWRHDLSSFAPRASITVREAGEPVSRLNELECVPDGVWANVWQEDRLVRVDSSTGRVTATVDARSLRSDQTQPPRGVLNGIAHRAETGTFLLTGKYWPVVYEVVFEPAT